MPTKYPQESKERAVQLVGDRLNHADAPSITAAIKDIAFAAPATVRTGTLDEPTLADIATALGLERSQILSHQWADNGPGWSAVEIADPDRLLALTPDFARGTAL